MTTPNSAATDILRLVAPITTYTVGLTDIIDDSFGTNDAGDPEILAITTLIREGAASTSDLVHRSRLSRRSFERLVRQLLADELVERIAAPFDGRIHLLSLTSRGRQRAKALEQRLTEYFGTCGEPANEVLAILGDDTDIPSATCAPSPHLGPLDVVERGALLGNNLDAAIRAQRAPKHPRNRAQLALLLIATNDPTRPSQLANRLTLSTGGVSRLLNRLESDGLVVRSHDRIPGDRRAVVVDLTPDGRGVITAIAAGLNSTKHELRTVFTAIAEYANSASAARR